MYIQSTNNLRRKKSGIARMLRQPLWKLALTAVITGFVMFLVLVIFYSRDLPAPGKVQRSEGFSTVFLDREGEVLFEMFQDKNRIPVDIADIPEYVKQATVAVEDKEFYSHQGFSITGIIRAAYSTLILGRLEGGSTLTQQLVKNVLLTRERTLTRKIKEFILAIEIERRYSKDEILEMYLNEAPYGGAYWGIESAAQGYFGKQAKDLTLSEATVLAGFPQRPSYYSPFIGDEKAYIDRTKHVLRRMREDDYITKDQEKSAIARVEKLKFEKARLAIVAPHFVFYVRDLIAKQFGEKILDQGIEVKTTLSSEIQKSAEKIVHSEIEKTKALHATNGSVVAIDNSNGQIIAMVGSYDYNDDKYGRYNTALALRQPGSAVKPFTYATAFSKGYTPSTPVMDVQTEFPDQGDKTYTPVNYDGKFRGPIQMRFALANSINIPAVKTLAMVGIKPFLQTASSMGIDTFAPTDKNMARFGLAITLGGGETRLLELTNAYSTFARGGERQDPIAILEIKDHKGRRLFSAKDSPKKRVLSEDIAFLISHILSDNSARADAFGTASQLNIPGKTVAVKTGTTNDKRDNWAVGYTKGVTVGVWVGNNDNSPMNERIASGLTGASSIWNKVMREALKEYKDGIPDKPDTVEALQIDGYLGGLPKDGYPVRAEYFIKGTEPKSTSPFYKKLKISRSTGRLANEVEIKKDDYDEKEYIVITEDDPVSTDGRNRWQEAISAWLAQQGDDKYKPPTETSDAKGDDVIVQIKEPTDNQKLSTTQVKVRIRILSVRSLRFIKIFIDDSEVKHIDGDREDIEEVFTLSDGVYKLGVKAENDQGKTGEGGMQFGVNQDVPTPTP